MKSIRVLLGLCAVLFLFGCVGTEVKPDSVFQEVQILTATILLDEGMTEEQKVTIIPRIVFVISEAYRKEFNTVIRTALTKTYPLHSGKNGINLDEALAQVKAMERGETTDLVIVFTAKPVFMISNKRNAFGEVTGMEIDDSICGEASTATEKTVIVSLRHQNPDFCGVHEVGHILKAVHVFSGLSWMKTPLLPVPNARHFDEENRDRVQDTLNRRFGRRS